MMSKYIDLEAALEAVETAQKALCPVCRWGRQYADNVDAYDTTPTTRRRYCRLTAR